MINCPNCEVELEENLKFCVKCGTKIEDIQEISQENNHEISCPNCSAQLPANTRFCMDCGTKIESLNVYNDSNHEIICPKCSAELPAGTKFCSECGTKTTDLEAGTSNANKSKRPVINDVSQNEVSVDLDSITKSGKNLAKGFGGLLKKTANEADKKWEKRKEQKIKENELEHDKKVEQGLIKNACGNDGELELYDDKIIIRRKGKFSFVQHGLTGDREVLINQITSIQLKHTGEFFRGYIQFSFAGAGRRRRSGPIDENTIGFWKDQEPDFLEIKEMIEAKMLKHQGLENTSEKNCDLNELEKLAELKEKGIITEEEFQAKKKQILGL